MKKLYILILLLSVICFKSNSQQAWTLQECIDYAIVHNLEVQRREVVQKQQEVDLSTAKNSRLPNLNANGTQIFDFGRNLNDKIAYIDPVTQSLNFIDNDTRTTIFSINTEIPLFTGFQITHNIALKKLDLKAAIEELNQAKDDISIHVTSAFLQVLFSEEIHKVALEQVNISKEQYNRINRLHEIGKLPISSVYEAKARVAHDELSATQAGNNKELALLALTQILELSSPKEFRIKGPEELPNLDLNNPEEIFNQAVLTRPGVLSAQYRYESAGKSIALAQSGYYPKLALVAGMGTGYYKISDIPADKFSTQLDKNFSQSVRITLSIPIFNRFETRNQVRSAKLQQYNQSIFLEERKKSLYKEIQQSYYNAIAAHSKYKASGTAVEAHEEAFRSVRERYGNGKATSVEYNESKLNLMRATSEQIQAKYEYIFRIKILNFYKGIPLASQK